MIAASCIHANVSASMIMSVFKEKVTGDNEIVGGGAVEVKSCGDGKRRIGLIKPTRILVSVKIVVTEQVTLNGPDNTSAPIHQVHQIIFYPTTLGGQAGEIYRPKVVMAWLR